MFDVAGASGRTSNKGYKSIRSRFPQPATVIRILVTAWLWSESQCCHEEWRCSRVQCSGTITCMCQHTGWLLIQSSEGKYLFAPFHQWLRNMSGECWDPPASVAWLPAVQV